jgi:hypothetical protein
MPLLAFVEFPGSLGMFVLTLLLSFWGPAFCTTVTTPSSLYYQGYEYRAVTTSTIFSEPVFVGGPPCSSEVPGKTPNLSK